MLSFLFIFSIIFGSLCSTVSTFFCPVFELMNSLFSYVLSTIIPSYCLRIFICFYLLFSVLCHNSKKFSVLFQYYLPCFTVRIIYIHPFSVQFSRLVVCNCLQSHELQHARLPFIHFRVRINKTQREVNCQKPHRKEGRFFFSWLCGAQKHISFSSSLQQL